MRRSADEWRDGRDDFQRDRDPRRAEERPRCSHGIPPADAFTGAQPGDQVHQGLFLTPTLRGTTVVSKTLPQLNF